MICFYFIQVCENLYYIYYHVGMKQQQYVPAKKSFNPT